MSILQTLVVSSFLLFTPLVHAADLSSAQQYQRLEQLAKSGDKEVLYHLGMFLNNGIGTQANPKAAFDYFLAAANQGHALAAFKVGCYYAGQFSNVVPLDLDKALQYKLVAAKAGYDLAQSHVGLQYLKMKQINEANSWLELAAKQGDFFALTFLAANYADTPTLDQTVALGLLYLVGKKAPHESQELNEKIKLVESRLDANQQSAAREYTQKWTQQMNPISQQARMGFELASELIRAPN